MDFLKCSLSFVADGRKIQVLTIGGQRCIHVSIDAAAGNCYDASPCVASPTGAGAGDPSMRPKGASIPMSARRNVWAVLVVLLLLLAAVLPAAAGRGTVDGGGAGESRVGGAVLCDLQRLRHGCHGRTDDRRCGVDVERSGRGRAFRANDRQGQNRGTLAIRRGQI